MQMLDTEKTTAFQLVVCFAGLLGVGLCAVLLNGQAGEVQQALSVVP